MGGSSGPAPLPIVVSQIPQLSEIVLHFVKLSFRAGAVRLAPASPPRVDCSHTVDSTAGVLEHKARGRFADQVLGDHSIGPAHFNLYVG